MQQVVQFRDERNWKQFHNAKDLAISISLEAAELLECFQWKSDKDIESMIEDPKMIAEISYELADVFIYILLLSDHLKVDLYDAVMEKLEINKTKYPVEQSFGKSAKYSEL
jgi:NTP pyrophosphatase (non-canonical NTP hydrolase)